MKMVGSFFLVGPMGSGKSTIGRALADCLGYTFFDVDHEIVEATGASIPTIFELEGEAGFRLREKAALKRLINLNPRCVLATGGGAVLDAENRQLLSARGTVIYLRTSVDEQFRRIGRDRNRPLVQTPHPQQKLAELFQQRDPLYQSIADWQVVTDGLTVKAVTQQLMRVLTQPNLNAEVLPLWLKRCY